LNGPHGIKIAVPIELAAVQPNLTARSPNSAASRLVFKPVSLTVSVSECLRASGVLPMCREAQFVFRSIELSGIAVFIPQKSLHQLSGRLTRKHLTKVKLPWAFNAP
jgi:hypothetical protein